MPESWKVHLLGRLRAACGDREVSRFPTRKTGYVLAMLALAPDSTRTRESLIEAFWPDSPPAAGRNSLSRALSGLRRTLETAEAPGTVVRSDRHHVGLVPGALETDVERLRSAWAAAQATGGSDPERLVHLEAAAAEYGGELLPGADGEWVDTEREALALLHLRVLESIVQRLLDGGTGRRCRHGRRRGPPSSRGAPHR